MPALLYRHSINGMEFNSHQLGQARPLWHRIYGINVG